MSTNEIDIPEYSMKLMWNDNKIQVYDYLDGKTRDEIELDGILNVTRENFDEYKVTLIYGKQYQLELDLITPTMSLHTGSEYILDVDIKSKDQIFYFGLYELGELKVRKDIDKEKNIENVKLVRTKYLELQYVNCGVVTEENIVFVGLRESETIKGPHKYYLAKLDWNQVTPKIISKYPREQTIVSMGYSEGKLILGYKNGEYEVWDPRREETITKGRLLASYFHLHKEKEFFIASSHSGEVAKLTKNFKVVWKTKISDSSIHAVTCDENWLHIIDEEGNYFRANMQGKIVDSNKFLGGRVHSNCVIAHEWIIAFATDGIRGFRLDSYDNVKCSITTVEPLYRIVISHPDGIISGDDTGRLRFWSFGKLKLIEEGY
ncbi:MAG: hypothetical protein ACTSW1_13705 [Candidatus Hodarchaeales archaeon]